MAAGAPSVQDMINQNTDARAQILRAGVPMLQQIFSAGQDPAANNIFTVQPQNVGLIRGFWVKVTGTLRTTGGGTATRTELGAANLVSQITFSDYNNTTRINTTGWHLHLINSAKAPLVYGGVYAPNMPLNYGVNWSVDVCPATLATVTDAPVSFYYYVPLAYAKNDLRGSVYAGLVSSTAQLQITINPTPFVAAGDATLAVFSGFAGQWKAATNVTVTVWQDYIDQLPMVAPGTPYLPMIDMGTMYELKNVSQNGMVVGQDFQIPFANLRNFLSTTVIFDNGGTLNAGTDVNYWALNSANTTSLFKYGPNESALLSRGIFAADPPKGVYHFSHRDRPINTQQFGNMTLVLNPSVVNANAVALVGYEDFATLDQVQYATALNVG